MASMSEQKLELLVGTFIIAGMILIGGMILTVSGVGLFKGTYYVVVRMDHIGDLQIGAPVKRSGVQIGRVTDIQLQKDHIRIVTEIDDTADLTKDATASIETAGVVGDTFLEFSQGTNSDFLKHADTVEEALAAKQVRGMGSIRMNELFHQVQSIGQELTSITKNVNEIIGDDEVKKNIRETIANTNAVTIEAKRLLKSLNRTSKNVEVASEDILATTKNVKEMAATVQTAVNDTIGDPKTREDLKVAMSNVRKLSDELLMKKEQLTTVLENVQVVSEDAKVITANIREVASAITPDTGIMPLFTSSDIRKEVNAALVYLRNFVSHEGVMKALMINRYAGAIAEKRLDEWRAHYVSADELQKKVMEEIKKGLGDMKEAERIIDRQEDPFLNDD